MGAIYLALQESVGRQVAIKVLPDSAFHDPDAVARFQREIQVLGQLKHPGICPVMDSGLDGKTHYYVMEHIRGLDLARVLGTQRVDPRRAATVAAQVAQALHSAHRAGVVHRDIKPLNIMLTRGEKPRDARYDKPDSTSLGGALKRFFSWATVSGGKGAAAAPTVTPSSPEGALEPGMPSPEWRDRAVLIDFGLARDGSASTQLTVSGALMGTPSYMAPEQARGDRKAIGPATDVYGLGATLYEMLTLRPPFLGETMGEVIDKVQHQEPVPVRRLNPQVDRDLETIVQKAMEKEPARRYADAAAMAQDLDHWLAGEAIQARRASLAYRIRKRVERNRLASAAIAAAVLLGAAGAWATLSPGEIHFRGRYLEGATILIDDVSVQGTVVRAWPGQHKVRITRAEFVDFPADVEVSSRKRTTLDVQLISRYGKISVTSDPSGAEVRDQDGLLGITPLWNRRVPTGDRFIELRLANYESVSFLVPVRADAPTQENFRQLRHETGTLTLTADPPELGIDLFPEGTDRKIIAAAPAVKFPLPTGHYRVVAHARNHFPREFPLEIRAGGEVKKNITLTGLMRWRTTADLISEGIAAGDLNGDGRPDVVVASKTPARIRALDGRNGELMWIVRKPPLTASFGLPMSLSDLDGDLEPEVVYAAGDRLVALDGRSGVEKFAWDFPGLRDAVDWGDLDDDGVPDFVAHTRSAVLAVRGADARTIWSVPVAGSPTYARGDVDGDGRPEVVIGNTGRGLEAISGANGNLVWRRGNWNTGGPISCVDANGDGADDILMTGPGNEPCALNGRNGEILWTAAPDDWGMFMPPVAGDLDGDGKLEAIFCRASLLEMFDAATGALLFKKELNPGCPPAIYDMDGDGRKELILIADGNLMALNPLTNERPWQFDSDTSSYAGTPILDDFDGDGLQDFVLSSHGGTVAAVTAVEPPVLWRQGNTHMHSTEPEVLGNPARFVFIPGLPHRLVDPADGRVLAEQSFALCKMSAVYSGTPPFQIAMAGQERALLEVAEDPPALRIVWNRKDHPVLSTPELSDLNGDGVLDFITGDGEGGPGVRAADGRNGDLLWNAPLGRPWRGDIAVWEGLVWVPAGNEMHGLDPVTGKEVRKLDLGGPAHGAIAFERDLIAWSQGGRVVRFSAARGQPAESWRRDLRIGLGSRSVAALGPCVVASGGRGTNVAIDALTGKELWRRVLEQSNGGGPGLWDIDGDGFPEVAVSSFDVGWIWVLEGTTGNIRWAWRTGAVNGWSRPRWADLDGDGVRELLATFRDGRAYAYKVSARRSAAVSVLRPDGNPKSAAAQSATELRRRAAIEARRSGRWRDIIDLASGTRDPFLAAEAAKAASRLGDATATRLFADLARTLHVRRLDVDLAGCLAEKEGERLASLKRALLAAQVSQISAATCPPGAESSWGNALAEAAVEAESRDDWERAVALHGLRLDYPAAFAAFERASRTRAPGSRLRLSLARAAVAADEFSIAREQFRAVMADPVLAATAQAELDGLQRLSDQLRSELRTSLANSDFSAASAAGERLVRLRANDAEAWNEFAWIVATSASPPPDLARRAVEAARRAIQLLDLQGAGRGDHRGGILDTLAAALFAAGQVEEAIRVQKEAIGMMSEGAGRTDLEQRLLLYERALRGQ
ncbi:MAG: serine/threonine protein [Planctomycetota bacterium]|nr:MAG: serine/threonine protein [Planctomycetota bacterium]